MDLEIVAVNPAPAAGSISATSSANVVDLVNPRITSPVALMGVIDNGVAVRQRTLKLPTKGEIKAFEYTPLRTVLLLEVARPRIHVLVKQRDRSAAWKSHFYFG